MGAEERAGRQGAEAERAPVFLVGARRSGSTLVRVMLNSHPAICFPRHFEIELAVQFAGPGPALPSSLDAYYDALAGSFEFRAKGREIDRSLGFRELLDDFLRQSLAESGKQRVMAVVHDNFDRVPHIWPEARFIYLVRDGRDVARSRIALGWDGNYWAATEPWIVAERQWQAVRQRVPDDRLLEVRYEDVVHDPEAELTRICRFVGLPYDAGIFDYLRDTAYERPDPALVGQWRAKLSEADLRLAEAHIGALLVQRGYELSGLPPRAVGGGLARWLRWHSKWVRRRSDLRRDGPVLFLLELATRRLGARSLHRRVRLAMDTRRQKTLR